jgi:hypothetical protein
VALAYHPVSSTSEAQTEIGQATSDASVDYWSGMMSAQGRGVICVGRLTNGVKAGIKVQGFTETMDPWFYMRAELLRKGTTPISEALPIADHLFGYYSGGVWVARYACKSFITPFNRITR